MEDLSIQVLNGYGLKTKSIKKSKLTYICDTDKGIRAIKSTMLDHNRINFIHNVKEHLYNQGFDKTDRFYKSSLNKPYFVFNGKTYICADHIDGKEMDFGDNEKTGQLISGLANMHKSGRNMVLNETGKKSGLLMGEEIISEYNKKLSKFKAIKKIVSNHSSMSNFDVMLIKNYGYLLNEAKEAIEILEKSKFGELQRKAAQEKHICHNALKEENVIFEADSLYIINFAYATIDHHLIDLADLIKRYIRKHPENYLRIYDIIEIYSAINSVSKDEIDILYALLKFPDKYLKVCGNYYMKKRSWAPSSIVNRFESLIEIKAHYKDYIDELHRI